MKFTRILQGIQITAKLNISINQKQLLTAKEWIIHGFLNRKKVVFLSSLVKYDHFPSFFFCVTLLCKNHPKNRENCTHFYNWPWKKAALIFPQCHFPKKGIHFILRNNPTLLGNFAPFFYFLPQTTFWPRFVHIWSLDSYFDHFLFPPWFLQGWCC